MHRNGISLVEVLVVILITTGLAAILAPFVSALREKSRQTQCQQNMRQLTAALHTYHDTYAVFPPAAIWSTEATQSLLLHQSKQVDTISMQNWVQLVLPHTNEHQLTDLFHADEPVGAEANREARTTPLAVMTCPIDEYNRADNQYTIQRGGRSKTEISFARGNYAINGGTHNYQSGTPSTTKPLGEHAQLKIDREARTFQLWGNGIAGINRSFSLDDFANGTSSLVAIEELRAGIHPTDPRGVWSLGQIGGSITWGHGVSGDNFSPNHQWWHADDILGCGNLHDLLGSATLKSAGMPCVDYVDLNQQATSRSRHPGGVYVSMLDGSVRFISNDIDPSVWHVMHSRETPTDVARRLNTSVSSKSLAEEEGKRGREGGNLPADLLTLSNALGMSFVRIPSGEFMMGLADENNGTPPRDAPAHSVLIPNDFLMSQFEVTQEQFAALMNKTQEKIEQTGFTSSPDDRFPITDITWGQARSFCERLTKLEVAAGFPRHYRLPTEAEWEYCSREGTSQPYRWHLKRSLGDRSGEAAGIAPPLPLTSVGSYPPNQFGLHDMRGNAWEWTADWYSRNYYQRSPKSNPQGPSAGFLKVVRGSDWRFVGESCHIDYPMLPPWKSNPVVGFRVVCEIVNSAGEGAENESESR